MGCVICNETLFAINAFGFILQWIIVITSVCNEELYALAEPGTTVSCYYANITVVPYILLTDFMIFWILTKYSVMKILYL